MSDMKDWNADDWHHLLSQYLDNRATQPNGLATVALLIADVTDAYREQISYERNRASTWFDECGRQAAKAMAAETALSSAYGEKK